MKRQSNTTFCHINIQNCMLNKTVSWNDMKFQRSKIVFNALQISATWRHIWLLWSCATRINEEVRKQAGQRISNRFITYVPDIHELAMQKTSRGRRHREKRQNRKNSEEQEIDYLQSCRITIADRSLGLDACTVSPLQPWQLLWRRVVQCPSV